MNCREDYNGQRCEGTLTRTQEDEWITFICDKCGIERVGHERKLNSQTKTKDALGRAGIPAMFLGQRFIEDEHNRDALNAARSWMGQLDEGMIPAPALFGRVGTGKSHMLAAVCARLIRDHSLSVLFRSARALLAELQSYDGDHERAWERATTVEVLAIDDLGAQRVTDDKQDRLADLIDNRYEQERPIVIATNFPPALWDERAGLDARTVSRLKGMTFSVELRGRDRRQERLGVAA